MDKELISFLEKIETDSVAGNKLIESMINSGSIQKFDLFKNVKKINIIHSPIYFGDELTGQPLSSVTSYIGGKGKVFNVETYQVSDVSELNEEIDLYEIRLSHKNYETKNLGYGIWKFPIQYDSETFEPFDKIEINYSVLAIENIKKITYEEAKLEAKKIILEKVSELLDSETSNIHYERKIILRCSQRSINNKINSINNKINK